MCELDNCVYEQAFEWPELKYHFAIAWLHLIWLAELSILVICIRYARTTRSHLSFFGSKTVLATVNISQLGGNATHLSFSILLLLEDTQTVREGEKIKRDESNPITTTATRMGINPILSIHLVNTNNVYVKQPTRRKPNSCRYIFGKITARNFTYCYNK